MKILVGIVTPLHSAAAGATCGSTFCIAAIGHRDAHHADTHLVALLTSPSTNHLYKLCTVFYGQAPSFISDIVTPVTYLPGRAHLHSAKNGDYNIPHVLSDTWNSLPRQLRGIVVASTFKRHLKSELFFQAYGVSTIASTVADPCDCLHY